MSQAAATPYLSVVVTAHHEGTLLHRTMRSIWRAVQQAETCGFAVEVLVILDRANSATRRYVADYQPKVRVCATDLGDLGPARNEGVQQARGRFVCFCDADDLFSAFWLARACRATTTASGPGVYCPEYLVFFGARQEIVRGQASTATDHHILSYLECNFRSAACCAPRELLLTRPYQPCPSGGGFGFEDWHWWCEVLADGVPIHLVPETCQFIRCKSVGSLWQEQRQAQALLRPTRLFDGSVLARLFAEERESAEQPTTIEEALARHLPRALGGAGLGWRSRWRRMCADGLRQLKSIALDILPQPVRGWLADQWRHWRERRTFALPAWLIEEWRSAHAFEPLLFPACSTLARARRVVPEQGDQRLGAAYLDLWRRLPPQFSHVILVPWLKTGGADRTALNYVRALIEGGLSRGVVVLATEDADSPWSSRLPAQAAFLPFGRLYGWLSSEQQRLLLARLLLQRAPLVVHNINSRLGYELLERHGAALRQYLRLYCHVFCDDQSTEGQQVGYGRRYLPGCIDALTALLGDNRTELDRLAEQFAFDRAHLLVHYQPVDQPSHVVELNSGPRSSLNVLWAGRLDRQKRPDLLAAIAERCRGYPLRFHVYGSAVIPGGRGLVPRGPNVEYHGPFDGFESLPVERFDAFLYTSQWDGLPNILLEALSAGLPVIAADVGGVAELVVNGQTGLLAAPFDDPEAYVQGLLALLEGRVDARMLAAGGREIVRQRHSWTGFAAALRATPGYCVLSQERVAA